MAKTQFQTMDLPLQWPLVQQLEQRGAVAGIDARLVNCIAEKIGDDYVVQKRPGYLTGISLATPFIRGQGGTNWKNHYYAIYDSTLYTDGVLNAGTGTGLPAGTNRFSFSPILSATGDLLAIQNTGGVSVLTGFGVGSVLTPVADVNMPAAQVPGLAYLNGRLYVMTSTALIYGSNQDDPTVWNALNVIRARIEPDDGICLTKQSSFVLALKQWTTEVFQDVGNPSGSELRSVPSAKINFGCYDADSLGRIDDVLFWVTDNQSSSPQVIMVDKLQPTVISTPAVEKLLSQGGSGGHSAVRGTCFKLASHKYYLVNASHLTVSLVYDITQKLWYYWTNAAGSDQFPIAAVFQGVAQASYLMQHITGGTIHPFGSSTNDAGVAAPVHIYTPNADFGAPSKVKTLDRMHFTADRVGTLSVRYSEDDYATWSAYQTVDLTQAAPMLDRQGSFYRRAYDFYHQADEDFRIVSANLTMDIGNG